MKKNKVKIAVFADAELGNLLFYIQSKEVTSIDRMLLLLLLYKGVRVSELVNIKLKDVDVLAMDLTVDWGKGEKEEKFI